MVSFFSFIFSKELVYFKNGEIYWRFTFCWRLLILTVSIISLHSFVLNVSRVSQLMRSAASPLCLIFIFCWIKLRGETALHINCDTLYTFRTKQCKEIIETVKINNPQKKSKISENFAIFNIYRLYRLIKWI